MEHFRETLEKSKLLEGSGLRDAWHNEERKREVAKRKVIDVVKEALEPFLQENRYELFHVEYVKEGKDWFLRVYIDTLEADEEGHIGTEDCEKVSRYLSVRLDELDPIEKNYFLEVSSPGLDRPLLKDSDYVKYKGKMIDISLYKSINGNKQIHGELVGLQDEQIIITDEKNQPLGIPLSQVSGVKLAVTF